MTTTRWPVQSLGQSGFRIAIGQTIIYTDPYLTDSVADLDGPELRRMVPSPLSPGTVTDATIVLVSHEHLDHCDPDTLIPLADASPGAVFIAPSAVTSRLIEWGIPASRVTLASESPMWFGNVTIRAIPAAHTDVERDDEGNLRCLGFLIEAEGRRVYFSGDTMPHDEIVGSLANPAGIDVAFLPVNERNHYKDRRGIIGNMSAREAFKFAEEIRAKLVVPMHWDLFAPNCVYPEEVEILYQKTKPPFEMRFNPEVI